MGSFIRLPAKDLSGRIDAGYYRPDYVANAKRLLDSSLERAELSSLVSHGRRTLYFGTSTLEEEQAPQDWVPFLTSDDLGEEGFFIQTRARRRVPPSFLDDYPAGRLRSGELLVKVKGPNQTTAYIETVPEYPVLVSGTIWGGLVRKDVVDPHYLVAALSCPYAVTARTRLRTNLNVEFLGADDLLSLALPKPTHLAQHYIGDKVRQAERLREHARRLDTLTFATFDVLTQVLPRPQKAWRVASNEVEAYRLNPNHFDPVVRAAIQAAGASTRLHPLSGLVQEGDIAGGATPLGAQYASDGIFFARVQNVKPLRLDRGDAAFITAEQDREIIRSRCRAGDVVLSITGYPGTASVVLEEDLPLNINQHSVRFAVSPEFGPGFVAAAINSRFGQLQVGRFAVGGTRDALDYTSVRSLLIPEFSSEIRERVNAQVDAASLCVRAGERLVVAAKLLVEQLIEGRITEADLIAAQKALEAGDRGADRGILQTLRQNGASDGKPLIPDLDGLYALLDEPDAEQDG
jgi:type I restriction enzyme, S subunit